ncbi:MAG: purine-nucleoside phosphorylase [Elusimicrobia bacterium]|nr:purine-nucleoside phosphorylase [Elusimicrobiota bacterium]
MENYLDLVRSSASFLRKTIGGKQLEVGIVLGSGLSNAVPFLDSRQEIPYSEIPGFPRTTVQGHRGVLILGNGKGKGTAVMQGRLHFYEGYEMRETTLPIRVLKELGMKTLLVTSAVGSLRKGMKPGTLVLLKDHINFMGHNPLRGLMGREFGVPFPDMTQAYDLELRKLALGSARKLKLPVKEGVFVGVGGPSYETPAEIRVFQKLGADVVGMSMVPEVIAARQMGVRVLGISWVANMASGLARTSLKHPDVLTLGEAVSGRLKLLLEALVNQV